MKRPDCNDALVQASAITEHCQLSKGDAVEWVVMHSQLIDPEEHRCAVSPPMLALNWDVARTVFNSLLEAALVQLQQNQDEAWLAKMMDTHSRLQLGLFHEYGPGAIPQELFILMDRRELTAEMYDDLYISGRTGTVEVRELPMPDAATKKTVLH
ncbi:hypothetical protein VPZ60_004244 [Salmonella enterica]|nr:hypothetical protein [Salmonella enterica]